MIAKNTVESAVNKRLSPLFLIDIAVPRDIDPAIHGLDNVFLYNIDDLKDIVESNLGLRQREAEKAEELIREEVKDFREWVHTLGVVPLIAALREKAMEIQAETMDSIERKLPDLTEREKRVLRKHTKSIVNQMLRDPLARIKELAVTKKRDEAFELFAHIFALEEQLKAKETETTRREATGDVSLKPSPWIC